jgi:hypothetical protein
MNLADFFGILSQHTERHLRQIEDRSRGYETKPLETA